ncbi:MAG TPA: cytochrome c family protein [Stellaceae bacterium]|nr:cytochrome c family protein [Stellaceae bacterium]
MSSFELNKIAASVLLAMIVAMVTGLIAEELVHPKKLDQNVYQVAGVEAGAAPKGGAAPAAPEKPAPLGALLASADPAAGEKVATKCAACHSFTKGAPAKVGPNLYGIIGDKRAHMDGFAYSPAMQKMGGTWTPEEISVFIYNPKADLPGTKMGFAGLPKPEDRANVIAYLNKNSDNPIDLSKAQ